MEEKRTIPQVQDDMLQLVQKLLADESISEEKRLAYGGPLTGMVVELFRETPTHIAKRCSDPVTAETVVGVRKMKTVFPDLAMTRVGNSFNVNQGRVSEIMKGKHDHKSAQIGGPQQCNTDAGGSP